MSEDYVGNLLKRGVASFIDSVLKDVNSGVKAASKKIGQARVIVKQVKEKPDGEQETWFETQEQEKRDKKKSQKT